MNELSIQFLAFDGCPLAEAARRSLEQALAEVRLGSYEEIDILDPDTPEDIRGWGSPTILVNGKDVSGNPKGNSVGCRIYPDPDRVPSPESIVQCIKRADQ